MDSTTFPALPDGADLLAVVGGHRYLSVAWVMRQASGGQPEYYCPLLAWPETPAAQLASRDATIADLKQRIAELEARLASREAEALAAPEPIEDSTWSCQRCGRSDSAPGLRSVAICMRCESEAPPEEQPIERKVPAGRVQCPHCPKQPWANRLAEHLSQAHPEPTEDEAHTEPARTAPAAPAPLQVVPDDPTWSCDECKKTTFARSLRDQALCVNCAQGRPIGSTNGQHVAA